MSNSGTYVSITSAISAIENIENELGIDPAGAYPNVRVRLDVLESRINTNIPIPIGGILIDGDVGGTTNASIVEAIQGQPVPAPSGTNTTLTWNGSSLNWSAIGSGFTAGVDLSGSSTSQEVIGIDGYVLPSLSIGNLSWTGSSWAYTSYPTSLPPNGSAGGDLTGTYPNPVLVAKGTSGTYGDGYNYPVITTDGYGRVINVTLEPVSSGSGFTAGGDLSGSSSSQKVIGLDGYVLPTLTSGYLQFNGSAWALSTPGGGFSAGGDLTGSSSSQQVAQISGATGNFDWLATVHNPSITHLPETTDTGATNLTINAQNAFSGAVTNVYGGSLYLQAGAASDTAPGASISLSGATPRPANASDMQLNADQYQFSAATTATGTEFILDPINANFYANSSSPISSLGSSAKYWNTTYTTNLHVNQITNTMAPTAGQLLLEDATSDGIVWASLSGDGYLSTSTPGHLTITGASGNFSVAGNLSVTGTETITGVSTFQTNAHVEGNLVVDGYAQVASLTLDGYAVPNPSGTNTVLTYNSGSLSWSSLPSSYSLGGDLSGTTSNATVAKIDGYTLPNPSGTNTVLQYTGSALQWGTVSGGGGGAGTIVNVTSATTLSTPTTLITHVFLKAVASGGYTIVLPSVSASAGFIMQVKDCGGNVSPSNIVYIQAAEVGTTIDGITAGSGQTPYAFEATYGSMRFASDGTSWYIE